jgi:transformation/transcription domain-associated protein
LAEFEHQRYDEVELPGQYLILKDNNLDFIKIDRFEPSVDIVRRHGSSYRRLAIRGSNGSVHQFVVQNPSARQSRREEKIMQFFRIIKK